MAPSSRVDKDILENSVALLEKRGFIVFIHPQTFSKQHQSAGTGREKVDAFHDLIKGKQIKAIFCAKGGNRAGTMLEHLDFKLIAKNPKIVLGFSDITTLLNAIHAKTGIVGYHGPMLRSLTTLPKRQVDQCFDLLAGKKQTIEIPKAKILKPGKSTGHLIGGNLGALMGLIGTPYQPDFKNAILFLEDILEETSRIDRSLIQLRNAGVFHQIKGLILGSFSDLLDTGRMKYGFTLKDCISAATEGCKIPVLMNAPFGHGKDLFTMPVGQTVKLSTTTGSVKLLLDA